jgi:1,4-alpha-glucan branching enzyme
LDRPLHRGAQLWVESLNRLYRNEAALHGNDSDPATFEWIDCADNAASVISLLRKTSNPDNAIVGLFNFTPVARIGYRVGVPSGGYWRELLNSDAKDYGGSDVGNMGGREAEAIPTHGRPYSLNLTLPPLGALFLKRS